MVNKTVKKINLLTVVSIKNVQYAKLFCYPVHFWLSYIIGTILQEYRVHLVIKMLNITFTVV